MEAFKRPMTASPFAPAERRVDEVIRILTQRSLQPISCTSCSIHGFYFHPEEFQPL
jgi:hypothetical protein